MKNNIVSSPVRWLAARLLGNEAAAKVVGNMLHEYWLSSLITRQSRWVQFEPFERLPLLLLNLNHVVTSWKKRERDLYQFLQLLQHESKLERCGNAEGNNLFYGDHQTKDATKLGMVQSKQEMSQNKLARVDNLFSN